jgi:hypothetical protein
MACICNDFYSRIKDMDGTQEDWAEISKIAEEYRSRCNNSRFAKDMMLAIMDELERTWEGSHKKKGAD